MKENKKVITQEEFKEKMKQIEERYHGDQECCHGHMDDLMCELLTSLGYGDGVEIFENTEKWYA